MRPEKLIISGWGPYKEKTEIDFTAFEGRGLFLVTGATGAGKTTIFDAITYALYGSLSGEIREKTSVRSDFADSDTPTFVELTMHHGGRTYRIVRNPEYERPRKRGKAGALTKEKENAVLYLPDGGIIEGIREVNAKVQEILVLDYAQFKQITMIAQGEFARLLTASPKDKTRIFRDIFGTGIYERFSQTLRTRANTLYGKVMEHRHKLEEDVRLLLADGSVKALPLTGTEAAVDDDFLQDLRELTEQDNWNYTEIGQELAGLAAKTVKAEAYAQSEVMRIQQQNDALTKEVTEKKQENEQIKRLQAAEIALEKLSAEEALIAGQKECLARARAAEGLLPYRIKVQTAEKTLAERSVRKEQQKQDLEKLLHEKKALSVFAEERDALSAYLECCRLLDEKRAQEKDETRLYKETLGKREEARATFLEKEKERDAKREAYAEADRQYRHAAVGIVARMLKPQLPCPVCGSTLHPNPAREEEGLPSEAELKRLKEAAERAEAALAKAQEQAVSYKTLCEEKEERLILLREQTKELARRESEEGRRFAGKAVFEENLFLQASYEEKRTFVKRKTERLNEITGRIHTGDEQLSLIEKEIQAGRQEQVACREAYDKALRQAGFSSEEECLAASLPGAQLAALEKQITDFAEQLAAAKSVKAHLEQTLHNKETNNIEELEEKAAECKRELEEKQNLWKKAHTLSEEVRKTSQQFTGLQKKREKAEEEYGYVKDALDNLASGNNKRRLVFEQYVLAAYFEEILRAANLRFAKMTGGRYEMSRVEEAGDGRTKDSLEIQVMDYYTGKTRSVKTLSGGESFKASLSLALGMSDVIQAANGGIRVDTLFIDEGFGALDAESLDQACETLMGLVENNRLIGIISHVPELRERIDSQLIIHKTNSGSHVSIHV